MLIIASNTILMDIINTIHLDLNPLGLADAWWQHAIMLLGAGIIGYIIGYRTRRRIAGDLEYQLEEIRSQLHEFSTPLSTEYPHSDVPSLATTAEKGALISPDSFTIIIGIDQQVEALLHADGITTYHQLSTKSPHYLQGLLNAAGLKYQSLEPATWPKQADLAANGAWEALKSLQEELNSGRR
jgi:predicted flap endonuclease-1-like 5' DNA nuclease